MVGVVVLAVAGGTALFITRARGTPPLPKPLGSTAAQAAAPSTTMITLKVTPASPVDPIITETLTATVSPATAAGVVQFTDGSAALDDPVAVIDGSASTTTSLPGGAHSLFAEFTPTDAAAFSGSISNTVDYPVNMVAATGATGTTITLEVTPASPVDPLTTETLTATVAPATVVGVVEFNDGSTPLGDPAPVTYGSASTTTTLPSGDHSLFADFTPADASAFSGSISNTVGYPVNNPSVSEATTTTITLEATPASSADSTTTETLTVTITPPTAPGTVQFTDATTPLGNPVTVSDGSATTTTTLAAGDHSLTAEFTPTDASAFRGSTSPTIACPVSAALATQPTPTTTTLQVTPGSSADLITTETLTARITPPTATGTVQFTDANTPLGGPVSLTDDTATTTITLPAGDHSLAAEFIPTNPADYGPSTSTPVLLKKPTPDTPHHPGAGMN